jgi:hypothetical protein
MDTYDVTEGIKIRWKGRGAVLPAPVVPDAKDVLPGALPAPVSPSPLYAPQAPAPLSRPAALPHPSFSIPRRRSFPLEFSIFFEFL